MTADTQTLGERYRCDGFIAELERRMSLAGIPVNDRWPCERGVPAPACVRSGDGAKDDQS